MLRSCIAGPPILYLACRTEMICFVDQDKIRWHNTFFLDTFRLSLFHRRLQGTGKGLCVKQPPRRLDAEASLKSNDTARATLAKRVSKHKKKGVQASFNLKLSKKYLQINSIANYP